MIKAYHLKQGMMSGNYPVWLDRDENVWFEAASFVSQSEAVIARAEEAEGKREHPVHGKRFYAKIKGTRNGDPLPTMQEWLAKQQAAAAKKTMLPREEWMDKPIQGVD